MSAYSPLGSLWNRWDLHFHTPSSFDYEDKSISNQQIVDSLIQTGLRVTYTSGSLENPAMSQFVTDVLEGTRWAFRVRDKKYQVGEG